MDIIVGDAIVFSSRIADAPIPAHRNSRVRRIRNVVMGNPIVAAEQGNDAHAFRIYFSNAPDEIIRDVVAATPITDFSLTSDEGVIIRVPDFYSSQAQVRECIPFEQEIFPIGVKAISPRMQNLVVFKRRIFGEVESDCRGILSIRYSRPTPRIAYSRQIPCIIAISYPCLTPGIASRRQVPVGVLEGQALEVQVPC